MRQSVCGVTRTTVLGFGCGSVLGRVGRAASLKGIHAAWDSGITLFDTARSYGYGEAEAVLGEFLRGKRDQAVIATKFGIAPQTLTGLKRVIVPAARLALQIPGVNSLRSKDGKREVHHGHFTVDGLRTSVEMSLRELRTDRVDVLFLHEGTAAALRQEDLAKELSGLVKAGKVLRIGLYAERDAIAEALVDPPANMGAIQFGADIFDGVITGFAGHTGGEVLSIANHPFGSKSRIERFKSALAAMAADPLTPNALREKLRDGSWEMTVEALFGLTLHAGVHALVLSMMHPEHVRANVRAIESCRFTHAELTWMRERLPSSSATP